MWSRRGLPDGGLDLTEDRLAHPQAAGRVEATDVHAVRVRLYVVREHQPGALQREGLVQHSLRDQVRQALGDVPGGPDLLLRVEVHQPRPADPLLVGLGQALLQYRAGRRYVILGGSESGGRSYVILGGQRVGDSTEAMWGCDASRNDARDAMEEELGAACERRENRGG